MVLSKRVQQGQDQQRAREEESEIDLPLLLEVDPCSKLELVAYLMSGACRGRRSLLRSTAGAPKSGVHNCTVATDSNTCRFMQDGCIVVEVMNSQIGVPCKIKRSHQHHSVPPAFHCRAIRGVSALTNRRTKSLASCVPPWIESSLFSGQPFVLNGRLQGGCPSHLLGIRQMRCE